MQGGRRADDSRIELCTAKRTFPVGDSRNTIGLRNALKEGSVFIASGNVGPSGFQEATEMALPNAATAYNQDGMHGNEQESLMDKWLVISACEGKGDKEWEYWLVTAVYTRIYHTI
jgi:hypothetical protein